MLTLQDCEMLAKQFEEDTEPGKIFTQKCRSYAKAEHVMAAEVKTQNLVPGNYTNPNYNGSYSSAPITPPQQNLPSSTEQLALQQAQQAAQSASQNISHAPYQVPPCPDNVTEDNWVAAHAANFAMLSALTTQPPQNQGNFRGTYRGTGRGGGRGNRGGRGGRGGQRGGGQGQGRGRGGKGRGQQQQTTPRPPPPPNAVPPGGEEWWNCTAQMEAKCLYPNPTNKGRCGYCYVPGHCYSQCGYKRMDVQAGLHHKVHPQAGKLPAKKHAFDGFPAAGTRQQKEQRFAISAARGELNIDAQQQQVGQQQQQQQNQQDLANMLAAAMAQNNQTPQNQSQNQAAASGAQHYGASALAPAGPPAALHAGASQHRGGAQGGALPKPSRPPIANQNRQQEVYNVLSNWAEEQDRQQAQQQSQEGYEYWD